jgi:hypothetical protein
MLSTQADQRQITHCLAQLAYQFELFRWRHLPPALSLPSRAFLAGVDASMRMRRFMGRAVVGQRHAPIIRPKIVRRISLTITNLFV